MTEAKKRLDALQEMDSSSALKLLVREPWDKHKFIATYKGVSVCFYCETKTPSDKQIRSGYMQNGWKEPPRDADIKCEWVPY